MTAWRHHRCFLLLSIVAILAPSSVRRLHTTAVEALSVRQMVMVRYPSRHTYGFSLPDRSYDLPLLELESMLLPSVVHFTPVDDSGSLYWVDSEWDLSRVASHAILTQAVFNMSTFELQDESSLDSITEVLANVVPELCPGLSTTAPNSNAVRRWVLDATTTEVVDMRNPNLSRVQRLDLLSRVGATALDNNDVAVVKKHLTLLRRDDGGLHIGQRTATGPAAGKSAPGKKPRRTYKGLLGTFALKHRKHHSPTTALEPELAFLMTNMAGISVDSRVLDPFCGSATLLLTSAAMGATHLVGVDRNATYFQGAETVFDKHGFPTPLLVQGDVLKASQTACLQQDEFYDAIVCDPPYNIGAPILIQGQDERPPDKHGKKKNHDDPQSRIVETSPSLIPALLSIARRVLKVNGRLVFFLPVRGAAKQNMSLAKVLAAEQHGDENENLEIVFGRWHSFSNTFSRWLVCMKRIK